jgi:AmmeMemoRadiSam system protein A
MNDPYTKLAREAVTSYLKSSKSLKLDEIANKRMLNDQAGAFVSLHNKKDGTLRGCIGTFTPTCENIAQEIVKNSISAALKDPRFPPLNEKDISEITFSVDIIGKIKPVNEIKDLNPKEFGILVKKSGQTGLLLPNLKNIESPEIQVKIACQKAGINPNSDYKIFKFKAERHEEAKQ